MIVIKFFQEEPVLLPEPLDVGWPVTGYKQVLPVQVQEDKVRTSNGLRQGSGV